MFNFQPIRRRHISEGHNRVFPQDVVRVTPKSIVLAPEVTNRLPRFVNPKSKAGTQAVLVGFQYDAASNALRLTNGSDGNGFTANLYPGGRAVLSGIPVDLRKLNIVVGDYKLADGYTDVYVLAV